ncbi:MAG: mycofactocin-coupled SDR family oxidoreductase [Nocardioides sp.]|uniref:mycofactocin-coupled SDR family oxidoreductase n=1 Tax=Nocardioides sp. TaxID=35761 RepID=UPI0039E6DC37
MTSPASPDGRVALVTGAARGIGAATVQRLVAEGYRVVAFDWCLGADSPASYPMATREDLTAVARCGEDGQVLPWVGDVRDLGALTEAATAAVDRWGRLDAAVAGAAVLAGGAPLWDPTAASDLALMWEIDVRGVHHTATATIPHMLAGPDPGGCRFVAIASAAGAHGLHRLGAYTTVKHAVVGLVRGLAADLVATGVTAVAVSPGSTRTAMLRGTAELYGVSTDELARHQLLHDVLEPDEIGATIAFCCSPEGRVLNGSVVAADGGFGG